MRLTLALIMVIIFAAWDSLAYAQFPPPGVYHCVASTGAPLGTLSLFAPGDYQFSVAADASFKARPGDPGNGKGQVTSASTSVTVQSGPLATIYHWKGSFHTDPKTHRTTFTFSGTPGASCGVKV